MSEDTAAEPQRANQDQNQQASSVGSCDSSADKPKMPVGSNRNLNSEKQQSGSLREPVQGPPSILDDLFGMEQTGTTQEGTTGNNIDQKNDPLAATGHGGEAAPDSEGEEIQYADLPDIADLENSIDWSDVRAADES
jgi:hypothetical protein